MPLVRMTLAAGRPAPERRRMADAVHRALVETANVPADDRFQVVHEVAADGLIFDWATWGSRAARRSSSSRSRSTPGGRWR